MSGDAWERRAAEVADLVVWSTQGRSPTLGAGRLVCVDGPAGSGKTTLGRALAHAAAEVGTVRLLHMDDMYDGWGGLLRVASRVEADLLRPLAEGRVGRYRRYDWHAGRFAEWRTVEPVDLLVLEGVGSGAASYHSLVTTLVWVEAPRDLRLRRGLARDGEELREQWLRWVDDEEALFRRERTRERADVVVDGSESEPAVVFV